MGLWQLRSGGFQAPEDTSVLPTCHLFTGLEARAPKLTHTNSCRTEVYDYWLLHFAGVASCFSLSANSWGVTVTGPVISSGML